MRGSVHKVYHTNGGKILIASVFALLLAACANIPLLFFDSVVIGDDLKAHYRWVSQFAIALQEGYFYPRWMPQEHLGIGEPAFLYYPPLFAYIIAAANVFTGDIWLAMKVVLLLANAAAGFLVFITVWRIRSFHAAWLSAACIQCAPMIFHTLYYHNFLPFYSALPLHICMLIWAYDFLVKKEFHARLAITLALLFLLHIVSAVMLLLVLSLQIAVYAVTRFRQEPVWPLLWKWSAIVTCGIGLASLYLLPALTTLDLVIQDQWYEPPYIDWRNSFVAPIFSARLFGMRWFSVQWIIALSLLAPLTLASLLLWSKRSSLTPAASEIGFLLLFSWIAWVLASEWSWPIWQLFEPVRKIQFPYRFLFLISISIWPALALLSQLNSTRNLIGRILCYIMVAFSLGLTGIYTIKAAEEGAPPAFNPETLDSPFGSPPMAYFITRTRGPTWQAYMERGGLEAEANRKDLLIMTTEERSQDRTWIIQSSTYQDVILPLYAFPAWSVYRDGNPSESGIDPATGLLTVPLSPGIQEVHVTWSGLAHERIGLIITILTITSLFITLVLRRL